MADDEFLNPTNPLGIAGAGGIGTGSRFSSGAETPDSMSQNLDTTSPIRPSSYADRVSNTLTGASLDAQAQGSKPISDIAYDLVTKAAPLTGAAVVNSFYNTAVEIGNFLGGDFHKATIEDEFGPSSETTAYYQQHAGPIEGAALAIGSLAPGLGAIKVLKLAQAGKFGNAMKITTGLASGIQDAAIKAAADDMVGNATGASLFGLSSVNKTKAILAGIGDQALQGVAYQTATLATMHASPITDANTFGDNLSDVFDAAKGFAVVGGLIEGASSIYKINKAIKAADLSTKQQEAFGLLGKGNYTPGDRVVKAYETLDQIPAPTNTLGQQKLNITTHTTNREIQKILIGAAGGDEEVAGTFRNFLEKGRKDGSIGPEELQNNLGQMSRIGRYDDIGVVSTPSDVFYIPSKIDPAGISTSTHDDLMFRDSHSDFDTQVSRAMTLTNPTQLPTIGRATDRLVLSPLGMQTSGVTAQKYAGVLDAYKQGVDIFISSDGKTHINPSSGTFKEVARPGESRVLSVAERAEYEKTGNLPKDSKPLESVGTILDTATGKLFDAASPPLPVVGDIGKPNLTNQGLMVGKQVFPQKAGSEFDPLSVTPLDANARYVWASLRGIKNSDSIASNDLPMLEQMYREKAAGFEHENIPVFNDGSSVPSTAGDLLDHISQLKQAAYGDLLSQGKNTDEIGRILNSPTSGMTKNFNSLDPADLITDPALNANTRHIRLAYDIGTTKDSEGNLLRGLQNTNYRVKLARDTNSDTVSNYLSTISGGSQQRAQELFSRLQFTKGAGDADILGAGSSFLRNANSDFGTIGQQSERMGRAVSEIGTQRTSVVADTLASPTNSLRRDPALAAEYGNFVAVRRMTGEHYVLLSDVDAAANKLPPNTAILEGAVKKDPKTGAVTIDRTYLPNGFVSGDTDMQGFFGTTQRNVLKSYYTLSPEVVAVERASQGLNNIRNSLRSDWWKSQGINKEAPNPDRLYTPPIDGSKYPFFAYVRQKEGYALGESGASIITARSDAELQTKIARLGPEWDAFTKEEIADFKRSQGEYEFNRNFMNNQANTELARKGILNNVVPDTRAQTAIDDLASWHYKQELQLLRDHVELHNAEPFAQLTAMGQRFADTGTARFGAITPFMARTATNPYNSYIRTALGVSSKDNYPLWQLAQERLESFGDTAFNRIRDAFGATRKGLLSVEDASKVSEKFGLGNPYGTALDQMSREQNYYGGLANQLPNPGLFSKFIATANTALGATIIRLDTFQQLIHAVTMPIMSALEFGSASKDLQKLLTIQVPGQQSLTVPGFSRTLFNAVKNYFGPDSEKLQTLYQSTGLTRDELQVHRQMINELSMPLGKLSESGWAQKIDNASQYAERLTGTKFTNQFIHFVSSDIGRQLGEAVGQTGQDLLDTIGTFSNRVLGNISAGQRAGIFQGPVGQAVGLFQSYQWNLMQQLLRHIGEGDVKSLAMGAGMQSSIFGLSSLPGFHALNSIIAEKHGNTQGNDLYSAANSMLGQTASDYLLYGSLSGLTGLSLYSRGDINPRSTTILPVNPLNFPSVSAGIRVYQTLAQLENNITTKGGDIPTSLLLAAEHNGLSRPLSGIAQLMQGFSTAPSGNLISTNPGFSDLSNISTMSRILGAKPLEEATAMDAMYRSNALKTLDRARLQELGSAAMTVMYGDHPLAPEVTHQFLSDYVKAGGNVNNFNSWFMQKSKDANTAAVNRVMENFRSPRSQSLMVQMGGTPLPDFRNNPSTTASSSPTRDLSPSSTATAPVSSPVPVSDEVQ